MCCQILKKLTAPATADICSFTLVEKGLRHVEEQLDKYENHVVLFLDINMPSQLNGWDVLDRLSQLPERAKNRLTVFMLSSSTRPSEKAKAIGYRLVKKFIPKPMLPSMTWLKEDILIDENQTASQPVQSETWVLSTRSIQQLHRQFQTSIANFAYPSRRS